MSMRAGMGSWDEGDDLPTKTTRQNGVVLVFKPNVSKQEVERILQRIRGKLDQAPHVHEFDPCYGGPVWYIP